MSLSRGCIVAEIQPNEWWSIVAIDEHDYALKQCEAYGPCKTGDEAIALMDAHASNPGGWQREKHSDLKADTLDAFSRATKWRGNRKLAVSSDGMRSGAITLYF